MSRRSRKVDADYLGDLAEGKFDMLCREVGVLATPPRKDRDGWDFHVVLPSPNRPILDAEPRLSCSVQVKGQLATTKNGPAITLSNWRRMIEDPNPWFVFVAVYDDPVNQFLAEPIRGILVHVDKERVTRVMRRLWESAAGGKRELHKQRMQITWSDRDVLPVLNGEALLCSMRSCIGDASRYLENKRRWRAEAGVGSCSQQIVLRFREEDVDFDRMASAFLDGEEHWVEFPSVEVSDVRFGIPVAQRPPSAEKFSFLPGPTSEKVIVTFVSAGATREEFSIPFEVRSTSVLPLPALYQKTRLVAPLLYCEPLGDPSQGVSWRWTFHVGQEEVSLEHLASAARAVRSLLDPGTRSSCRIEYLGEMIDLDFSGLEDERVPDEVLALVDAAINAGAVARSFGCNLDQIRLHPDTLTRQSSRLAVLADLFSGTTPQVSLKANSDERELHGRQLGHVMIQAVRLGDSMLLVSLGLVGIASWVAGGDGGELLINPAIRVLERRIVKMDAYDAQIVRALIDSGESRLEREGLELIRFRREPQKDKAAP